MKYSLIFTLALVSVAGCRNREPAPAFQLPAATQTGANTMGFVVDDRVWQNHGRRCTMYGCHDNQLRGYVETEYNGAQEFVLTAGLNAKDIDEGFSLSIDSLRGPGVYDAELFPNSTTNSRLRNSLYFGNTKQNQSYWSRPQSSSRIVVTRLDTVARIISGTFEGRLYNLNDPAASVVIRDGRFDVKYEQ
ncbi:DUF5025 domain-containing protein [Hymenobacter edaphi]|uniref:Lipoprotein n=1 Tax=Hymenobacter edaphi TaxID=2211146 RepID=A0A328BA78_9BACT|nr:DUF5025 domain-containing protein [Hymenobacter edaphi]RAK63887.1 hypothetical protein DLM85_20280 [Hymenobacter edaphi]